MSIQKRTICEENSRLLNIVTITIKYTYYICNNVNEQQYKRTPRTTDISYTKFTSCKAKKGHKYNSQTHNKKNLYIAKGNMHEERPPHYHNSNSHKEEPNLDLYIPTEMQMKKNLCISEQERTRRITFILNISEQEERVHNHNKTAYEE